MRSIKRMIAVAMLAMIATMGSQSVMADGVLLSDRSGVLLSDKASVRSADETAIIMVIANSLTGVLLSD